MGCVESESSMFNASDAFSSPSLGAVDVGGGVAGMAEVTAGEEDDFIPKQQVPNETGKECQGERKTERAKAVQFSNVNSLFLFQAATLDCVRVPKISCKF